MTLLLFLVITVLLVVITCVQRVYLASLRLQKPDLPSFDFQRAAFQQHLKLEEEEGAFRFSIIKHSILVLGSVLLAGSVVGPEAFGWMDVLEGTIIAGATMVVATYLVPEILGRRTDGRWIVLFLPALKILLLLFLPLTALLHFLESLYELSRNEAPEPEATAEEKMDALISAGEEEGLIEQEDKRLIRSVVAFGDKRVREVMTPRPDIVAIQADRSLEDLRQLVIREQFSRVPVYGDSLDNIIGFIHVRDMFEMEDEKREQKSLRDISRNISVVPETKKVADLMREMQEKATHIAVVVDQFGMTAGLVTMEDLVEEIVGEIRDEHEPGDTVIRLGDGSVAVAGSYDVDHLEDLFGFRRSSETEATTVGGLVTEWAGEVPKPGMVVEREGLSIEVLQANELRVEQVRIRAMATKPSEADQ